MARSLCDTSLHCTADLKGMIEILHKVMVRYELQCGAVRGLQHSSGDRFESEADRHFANPH
jgi:hypothetical protein